MTLSTPDIERLKGLLEKATAGPWGINLDRSILASLDPAEVECCCDAIADLRYFHGPFEQHNAELIVAAINALPALLSDRADLEAEVERLKERADWEASENDKFKSEELRQRLRAQAAEAENARLREGLKSIADESVFNQMRFAEDTDTDYFLRCFASVKQVARALLHEGEK